MTPPGPAPEGDTLVERRVEEARVVELHRCGEALEVRVDGQRLFATDAPRCEQALVELALAPLKGRDDAAILLAGLGAGRTLLAALATPGVKRVDVVEASPAVVDWAGQRLGPAVAGALADPRVKLHIVELNVFLKQLRIGATSPPPEGWLALVIDLDEGPDAPSRPENARLYTDEGIDALAGALRAGGVLALWSPKREPALLQRLHARLVQAAEVVVPVEVGGSSGLDYIYRARRGPSAGAAARPSN